MRVRYIVIVIVVVVVAIITSCCRWCALLLLSLVFCSGIFVFCYFKFLLFARFCCDRDARNRCCFCCCCFCRSYFSYTHRHEHVSHAVAVAATHTGFFVFFFVFVFLFLLRFRVLCLLFHLLHLHPFEQCAARCFSSSFPLFCRLLLLLLRLRFKA